MEAEYIFVQIQEFLAFKLRTSKMVEQVSFTPPWIISECQIYVLSANGYFAGL